MRKWFFILVFLLLPLSAQAVHPDEILKDSGLESRARVISRQLRCLVCQGEDIDESAAPLAGDLRRVVRQRLKADDTDAEVLKFVQERYGDFVLMNPPVRPGTYILWFLPAVVLLGGVALVLRRADFRKS